MASVQQTITLTVTVSNLTVGPNGGTVFIQLSPTAQRFPAYNDILTINAVTGKYIRNGVEIGDVNPAIFTGPGQNALALVTADVDAMTAAGVFNL